MPWEDLIAQARKSLSDPNFDNHERIYKLQIAEAFRDVFELAESGGDWPKALRRAFGRTYGPSKGQYNLSRFSQHQWLVKLEGEPAEELRSLFARMTGAGDAVERFAAFADFASRHADKDGRQPGSILIVGSVLNMATNPEHFPPIKTTAFKSAEKDVGYPSVPDDIVQAYPHHLNFIDECRQRFQEADLAIRDRLDVQSIVWEWQNRDEPSSALHILQRWSYDRDPDTIQKHQKVAEEHGAVWWGRLGDPEGRAAIGKPRLKELQAQVDAGTPTYVFLHRTGEVWRTRLVEIRTDRPTDELELIPEYYRDDVGKHHLWLKLHDFEPLEADYAEKQLVMDDSNDPESIAKAFRDQQSFLYVRLKSEGVADATDTLAASVATFRIEYPYSDDEKSEKAVKSLALAAECRPALSPEALENPDWNPITRILSSTLHGNLGPAKSTPLHLIESGSDEDRQKFANAIRGLLHEDADLPIRLESFLAADLPGISETVAMKLLSIWEPARVLHIFKVHGHNGKAELMALPPVSLEVPEAESPAELQIQANDLIRERLAPYFGDDCYGMTRYLYWLAEQVASQQGDEADETASAGLEELAKTLYLDESGWLEDAADLVKRKRQLILYGPPGTGKTYIALKLMKHLAPLPGQREVVQFHPSYSYEDFVRGYRPVDTSGELTYRVVEGPLIRLAETARKSLESGEASPHILLIDEINRGNLPRILGELLYLLEYRADEDGVQLMYGEEGEERFTLPENLWIIGTMNTADRSIGLIDAALRRRFHFKSLFPGEPPIKGTLRRWLHDNGLAEVADYAADLVDRLNERLMEQQGSYGENLKVGHSYFMEEDLDLDLLSRIWASDVLPYLEEQLFGREIDVKAAFSLEALESEEASTAQAREASEPGGETADSATEGLLDVGDNS